MGGQIVGGIDFLATFSALPLPCRLIQREVEQGIARATRRYCLPSSM